MARRWSIKIEPGDDGKTVFRPDVPDALPGDPLGVELGDHVRWSNETDEPHWPIALDPPGLFLTNEVAADSNSSPAFSVPPEKTITYRCLHHPEERGIIMLKVVAQRAFASVPSKVSASKTPRGKAKGRRRKPG